MLALDHVGWTVLGLDEQAAYVLPEDPERQELDAAQEQHHGQQRGVARRVLSEDQHLQDDLRHVDHRRQRQQAADVGPDPQGNGRKGQQAVEGEVPELPESERRPRRAPFVLDVRHANGGEARPGEQPLHEAILLGQSPQHVRYAAVDEAEVAGVLGDLHPRERVEQAVEPVGRQAPGEGLGLPRNPRAEHDVVAFPPTGEKGGDDLRRMLQVGVDDHHHVSARVVDAGGERRLLPEVPRQVQDAARGMALRDVEHPVERRVGQSVVDEHDLVEKPLGGEDGLQPGVQRANRVLLVVGRDDDRDERTAPRARGRALPEQARGGRLAGGHRERIVPTRALC